MILTQKFSINPAWPINSGTVEYSVDTDTGAGTYSFDIDDKWPIPDEKGSSPFQAPKEDLLSETLLKGGPITLAGFVLKLESVENGIATCDLEMPAQGIKGKGLVDVSQQYVSINSGSGSGHVLGATITVSFTKI